MNLTPQQQAAAYIYSSVVVEAGAGTGKTHLLTERFLFYLQNRSIFPLEIVAVTFTEKAAEELRSRIRSAIQTKMPTRRDTLAELEAAQISTIHALASRICAEFSEIAGIPATFTVLESSQGQIWLQKATEEAIAQLPSQYFQDLPYSLMKQCLQALLDDPYTASIALQKGVSHWEELISLNKSKAIKELVSHKNWQKARDILRKNIGNPDDKLEPIRQEILLKIDELEQGDNSNNAIAIIDKIKVNIGSKKNWEDIALVKDALKEIRDITRESIKTTSIASELSAADSKLEKMLPAIAAAYREVTAKLNLLKQQERILSFSDLELYALKALSHAEVRDYYQQRWKVFLVDEFQDTNPTQGELIKALTSNAELTIVGDFKQSIYGFRRADIAVFSEFKQNILQRGKEVILDRSFRTHQPLISQINQVFAPLLNQMHQDLVAHREDAPSNADTYIKGFAIDVGKEYTSQQRQQLEAQEIARRIKEAIDTQLLVHDKQTNSLRSIEPGDFLIITRTWQPLATYGKAIASLGIPIAPAGGGNLLATREAKDCWTMLRFLSDTKDDIALVALLRSPWFAISDRLLLQLALARKPNENKELPSWWEVLQNSRESKIMEVVATLQKLLQEKQDRPSRLLQKSDRALGYRAIISNLPEGKRRVADWQGFYELVKELETGTQDLFGVVRDLKQLYENDATIARPPLEIGNAVGLMTIYAAKGLERAYVIVADLSKQKPPQYPVIYFDSDLGVAIKSKDETNSYQKPVLYTHLENQRKQQQAAEDIRVMYVALTRARDYLLLTAKQPDKGDLKLLAPGLENAGIEIEKISEVAAVNSTETKAVSPLEAKPQLLIDSVGSGLFELPVTALTEYARCPQRFWLLYLQGHPGVGEGMSYGMEIGSLVHTALELNIKDKDSLMPFSEQNWQGETVIEALELVTNFLKSDTYKIFRDTATAKEQPLHLQIGSINFSGIADLVGKDWLMDYKSDRDPNPLEHRFQIWAYAKALGFTQAHIAYLRHDRVVSFNSQQLQNIEVEAIELVKQIETANYTATPSIHNCSICPYSSLCEYACEDAIACG